MGKEVTKFWNFEADNLSVVTDLTNQGELNPRSAVRKGNNQLICFTGLSRSFRSL